MQAVREARPLADPRSLLHVHRQAVYTASPVVVVAQIATLGHHGRVIAAVTLAIRVTVTRIMRVPV